MVWYNHIKKKNMFSASQASLGVYHAQGNDIVYTYSNEEKGTTSSLPFCKGA